MDIKQFDTFVEKLSNDYNSTPQSDFESLSPNEMQYLVYNVFGEASPLKLEKLSDEEYAHIPIFNQIKYLAQLIDEAGEIKLTNNGYLPPKYVKELYNQGFLKEELIEIGFSKLNKEVDSMTIQLTHILISISHIAKKRHGKLSLTATGKKMLNNNEEMFNDIFFTYCDKFNWAYFDGYGQNNISQLGYGFSLLLIAKYGNKMRQVNFYAEKYFKAFPHFFDVIEKSLYSSIEEKLHRCYSIRTFKLFLNYFGLINTKTEKPDNYDILGVSKTQLFDKLITFRMQS